MSQSLAQIQKRSYRISKDHGFWDAPESDSTIPLKLALIHSEISEALDEYRHGRLPIEVYYEGKKPEGFGIELADAIIRICDLAERYDIDLGALVEMKAAYNEGRPHMHNRRV